MNTMQDWNKYVERPYQEVFEELKAEGYQVVGDDLEMSICKKVTLKSDWCVHLSIWTTLMVILTIKRIPTSWMVSIGTRLKSMMKKGIY